MSNGVSRSCVKSRTPVNEMLDVRELLNKNLHSPSLGSSDTCLLLGPAGVRVVERRDRLLKLRLDDKLEDRLGQIFRMERNREGCAGPGINVSKSIWK